MERIQKPKLYYKDIFNINYKKLKNNNIKYLLFDIDNTIGDDKKRIPSKEDILLFKKLQKDFKLVLISNALKTRVKRYAKYLNIKDYYYLSLKPLKHTYNKIINKYNINTDIMAAIGDQLYTDIKGANKIGITSILVDKISNNETIFTKINRVRENRIIKKYKIIERGSYSD